MSHFTVAVFTEPDGKSLEELLAPYDEELSVAPYVRRTKAKMIEDAKGNKARLLERIKTKPELEFDEWTQEYLKAETDEELYQTQVYEGDLYDLEGNEMSTYNPSSKWDWYSIGGRWSNMLKTKDGVRCDSTLVSNLDLTLDLDEYRKAIRFWEIVVEERPLTEFEEKPFAWRKEYYVNTYKDKETYARLSSTFSTYAVVTPDGVWHQKGEMGWWGMSSETPEEALDWELHYKERFLDTANPEWELTVIDCHI